ncbi:MAG: hypothetical protein QW611_03345 [Ignisphaera sp.]
MYRGISELVALLILIGVTSLVFLSILYIVPAYFRRYTSLATEYGFKIFSTGVSTDGHLKRVDSKLIVFIYNYGNHPITVSYRVTCASDRTHTYIGGENNVYIGRNNLYVRIYSSTAPGVCYLVVEESNSIIYKVVES